MIIKNCLAQSRFSTKHGFTLLEVLVTLIVLSVGLLSIAGLKVVSLRTSHSAYMRSQATGFANDMIDRMRANSDGVALWAYDQPTRSGSAGTKEEDCELNAGCDPNEMAAHDLFIWNDAIAAVLPNGFGMVCIDSVQDSSVPTKDAPLCTNIPKPSDSNESKATAKNAVYAVKIWWDDDQGASDPKFFATSFRP